MKQLDFSGQQSKLKVNLTPSLKRDRKVKPKHLDKPLVAGCSMDHKLHPSGLADTTTGQTRKSEPQVKSGSSYRTDAAFSLLISLFLISYLMLSPGVKGRGDVEALLVIGWQPNTTTFSTSKQIPNSITIIKWWPSFPGYIAFICCGRKCSHL